MKLRIGDGGEWDLIRDEDAEAFQPHHATRVISQKMNTGQPEVR
jgi:hypothetical protein